MALLDTPEKAMRLARAIAGDIALYNEEKIIQGIQDDNLFDVLEPEIQEGLTLYKSRVAPELYETTNFFNLAIVDVILMGKGHIKSNIW